jgi:diadenosine tetraphosphatase ApaH/serine/threonine PP2A family protein phosphatase
VKAILSDIHGNLQALQAVLSDIASRKIEAIYCLGDTVTDGPNPRECLELAMHWELVLLGDRDLECIAQGQAANLAVSGHLVEWTRQELNAPVPDAEAAARRRKFLSELPQIHRENRVLFVHGSPRRPLDGYLFPEDVFNLRKLQRTFASVEQLCFTGHTHVPGIFTEDGGFSSDKEAGTRYLLDGRKTIVNVGSVGMPRDGDWRACYVTLDDEAIEFRRVDYGSSSPSN